MPNIRWLLALITRVHRFVYRATGGRVGGNLAGTQTLLLTTVGRRTGRERVTPLLFVRDGDDFVVVASNAGDARDPAWWWNLRERPDAKIQVGTARHRVRARRADAEEAQRLWPLLEDSYRYYEDYRRRAGREIPIVILERSLEADAAA